MKLKHAILLATTAMAGICQATVYNDSTSEIAVGTLPHLDITSVEVTTDGTDITFKINLNGDPVATNWGKYMIALRTGGAGTTTGNGWGRPINFTPGMTRWVAAWVDSGNGAQSWSYAGSWSQTGSPAITKDTSSVTLVASAASLAIGPGETFSFDVYTSGGGSGDSAVDALSASAASVANWGDVFVTNAVGGTPNPALSFTMPGAADYSTWIGEFGLAPGDQDPGDDPDGDTLTNQQEYDLDLELNPSNPDTDGDLLNDNVETATGIFVDEDNTGSQPSVADSDGDGANDGEEVSGDYYGFQSNPNIHNWDSMAVPGDFTDPTWQVDGSAGNDMERVDDTLTGQYQWRLHYNFRTLGAIEYKFAANLSWDHNWGNGGGNITANIRSTGFHTFTFNSSTQARSLVRRTYADAAEFLTAYGGLGSGTDTDGDGVNNEAEFTANTDPTEDDTDGDGTLDGADSDPLQASRSVVFKVDMSVQETLGNFNPANSVVVKFFTGNVAGIPDLTLTEIGDTGVYTGTQTIPGLVDDPSGGFKFFNTTAGAPNSGYEDIPSDRTFTLGAANATQTLDVVFFNNNPGGFSTWLSANAPGQTMSDDHDGDGVDNGIEYFMGQSGSSFTPPPTISGKTVSWTKGAGYTGTYGTDYVVQTSTNLINWTDVAVSDPALNNGSPLQYTLPDDAGKIFVRLSVTGP